jgi:hypothetical protein
MAEPKVQYLNLIKTLCIFNNCCPHFLDKQIKQNKEANVDYINSLGTLQTIHLRNNIFVEPYTISDSGANRVFALGGYLGITVEQYFYSKNKFLLKYPQLPCIVVKGGRRANGTNHFSYFPLESLVVCKFI